MNKNMSNFLNEHKDYDCLVSIYKKMFTPYEMNKKFSDESVYMDSFKAKLIDFYELPLVGDYLLKFKRFEESFDDEDGGMIMYDFYRLSEINLSIIQHIK